MIQVEFKQDNVYLLGWVQQDRRLHVGTKVKLKGKEGWWKITQLFHVERDLDEIHVDWNNNNI